jgi:hypothetical protein
LKLPRSADGFCRCLNQDLKTAQSSKIISRMSATIRRTSPATQSLVITTPFFRSFRNWNDETLVSTLCLLGNNNDEFAQNSEQSSGVTADKIVTHDLPPFCNFVPEVRDKCLCPVQKTSVVLE